MGNNRRKRSARSWDYISNKKKVPLKDLVKVTSKGHFKVNILGVIHTLKFDETLKDEHGWCDTAGNLVIEKSSRGRRRLETIIHETLHRLDWSKDEQWITEAARLLATLIWEMGYRGDPHTAVKSIEYESK